MELTWPILGIVHGDIKPHNVLIFQDELGAFRAKITDFGYSTCYFHENDLIQLPKSMPWNAPEYNGLGVTPAQARKMDIFSLGILFFWLIFERYLSNVEPFPEEAQWASLSFEHSHVNRLQDLLEDFKRKDKLVLLAHQLLSADEDVHHETKQELMHLFNASLATNPDLRGADIEDLLKQLEPNR
jgi:serine/threonine protein kinase